MEPWLAALSPDLFWDVPRETVNPRKNLRWLVERIVLRGRWEDWILLRDHLSWQELEDFLPRLNLPPRERNFLKLQLETWNA